MAGLDDSDGYEGTALLEVGRSRFDVQVRLRGHFQPIDGRYHWYGRIDTHEALDELPENQREVFVAHELMGKSFNEIAEETGTSVNTLLSRKRYAVLHLRERLQELKEEFGVN